jgi:hypothetical protein
VASRRSPSPNAKVKVKRTGSIALGKVSCAATAQLCASTKVVVKARVRGKGKRRLPAVIATRTFRLVPGQSKALRLSVAKRTRGLLRARGSVPVVVTVTGAGAKALTVRFVLIKG